MRNGKIVALVASVLVATPAVAADQFDLLCKAKKAEVRYRVDLARGEWCAGECSRVVKIAQVTTGEIVFEDIKALRRGDYESQVRVNRATGDWSEFTSFPASVPTTRKGVCTPARFSTFPAGKF